MKKQSKVIKSKKQKVSSKNIGLLIMLTSLLLGVLLTASCNIQIQSSCVSTCILGLTCFFIPLFFLPFFIVGSFLTLIGAANNKSGTADKMKNNSKRSKYTKTFKWFIVAFLIAGGLITLYLGGRYIFYTVLCFSGALTIAIIGGIRKS